MSSDRTQARQLAVQALYARESGGDEPNEDFSNIVIDDEVSPEAVKYARQLYLAIEKHQAWADEEITRLAENWRLERIARLDRIILRLGMVELKYMVDVPVKVAINEAIELAKLFSTPQSSGFVNGILDSFAQTCREA